MVNDELARPMVPFAEAMLAPQFFEERRNVEDVLWIKASCVDDGNPAVRYSTGSLFECETYGPEQLSMRVSRTH